MPRLPKSLVPSAQIRRVKRIAPASTATENHHRIIDYPYSCTQSQKIMAEQATACFGGQESVRIRIIEFIRASTQLQDILGALG